MFAATFGCCVPEVSLHPLAVSFSFLLLGRERGKEREGSFRRNIHPSGLALPCGMHFMLRQLIVLDPVAVEVRIGFDVAVYSVCPVESCLRRGLRSPSIVPSNVYHERRGIRKARLFFGRYQQHNCNAVQCSAVSFRIRHILWASVLRYATPPGYQRSSSAPGSSSGYAASNEDRQNSQCPVVDQW